MTEPEYQPCARCIKHGYQCAIDPGFRRQEKRQQVAEIEKELAALKAENAELKAGLPRGLQPVNARPSPYPLAPNNASPFPGPSEAAASRSLLDLAQGYDGAYTGGAREPTMTNLARITLSDQQVSDLFTIFFAKYHLYLPLLSPDLTPTACFALSPLLYWTLLTVASRRYEARPGLLIELKQPLTELLWNTIGSIPQTYHVVKALCLLCAWPLPTNSTSLDPSMILCGTMVQLAMRDGLHRPSHAQDFSRYKIELREEDIQDRMTTWAAVNITAQKYDKSMQPLRMDSLTFS